MSSFLQLDNHASKDSEVTVRSISLTIWSKRLTVGKALDGGKAHNDDASMIAT